MTSAGLAQAPAMDRKPRVVVISGPTGVGKTRVALALAQRLDGEIVSADSVQVYRGLDVGSAKSRLDERQGIPHHLIDIVDPTDDYTAGAFVDDARQATEQIISRGRVPIVVGGTGFYIRWFLNGKPGTPKENPEIVSQVDEEVSAFQNKGDWDGALKLLEKAGDGDTGESLNRNDWYRLRRALSIVKATGLPRSQFQAKVKLGDDSTDAYEFLCYFLYKRRVDLYRTIDARCEEMLAEDSKSKAGILAEASWLLDLAIEANSSPPSRAIGYRQAMEYLAECRQANGKSSEEDFLKFVTSFQKASRNYARRQVTWFRNEPQFQWLDASQPTEKLVEFLLDDYHKPTGLSIPSRLKLAPEVAKREQGLLKTYVSQNNIFLAASTCIPPLLEWIRASQDKKIQQL